MVHCQVSIVIESAICSCSEGHTIAKEPNGPTKYQQPESQGVLLPSGNRVTGQERTHTVSVHEVEEDRGGGDPDMLRIPLGSKDQRGDDGSDSVVYQVERLCSISLRPSTSTRLVERHTAAILVPAVSATRLTFRMMVVMNVRGWDGQSQ